MERRTSAQRAVEGNGFDCIPTRGLSVTARSEVYPKSEILFGPVVRYFGRCNAALVLKGRALRGGVHLDSS